MGDMAGAFGDNSKINPNPNVTPQGDASGANGANGSTLFPQPALPPDSTWGANPMDPTGTGIQGNARFLGNLANYPIGQVDVRTPLMKGLENASAPLLFAALTNPGSIVNMLSGVSGAVPGMADMQAQGNPAMGALNTLSANGQHPQYTGNQQSDLGSFLTALLTGGASRQAPGSAPGSPLGGGAGAPFTTPTQPSGFAPPANPGQGPSGPPNVSPPLPGGLTYGQPTAPPPAGQANPNGGGSPYQPPTTAGTTPTGTSIPFGSPVANPTPSPGLNPAIAAWLKGFPSVDAALNDQTGLAKAFGAPAPGGTIGYNGLAPNWGTPGNELNLSMLNNQIVPQGYLAGVGSRVALTDIPPLNLYGAGGANAGTAANQDALQGLLKGLGLSFHADGGALDPNALNIVGEKGPEAIMGNQVVPLTTPTQPQGATQAPSLQMASSQAATPLQSAGDAAATAGLSNNPEQDVFSKATALLSGGANPGQGVVNAMQPVFNQNLQSSLAQLRNMSPSTFNSGIQGQGADLARTALNDFNLTGAQTLLQGGQQQTANMSLLGQLASQAGQNPFNRGIQAAQTGLAEGQAGAQNALTGAQTADIPAARAQNAFALDTQQQLGLGNLASQQQLGLRNQDLQQQLGLLQLAQQQNQFQSNFGLQQQQQAYNQNVSPTLQLLMAALGMATPTAYQTIVPGQK